MSRALDELPLAVVTVQPLPTTAERPRLDSVDRLRGLVMVLMALDHVRGYFTSFRLEPTHLGGTIEPLLDPAGQHAGAALFLTRWISHFCAPTFIFLAGTGAYLAGWRGKTKPELAWFLFTRGLWIVLLELTLVKLAWSFQLDFHEYNAGVLWAIGWSMVVLAGLVFLPTWVVATFGLVMIAGHNLLDPVRPETFGVFSPLWEILHRETMYRDGPLEFLGGQLRFGTQYPLIPWIGVMAVGYSFGALLLQKAEVRRACLLGLGSAAVLAFVLIRWSNAYGNPEPWSPGEDGFHTVLSMLNCHKYPPSLCYLLMTLGPALLMLALFERAPYVTGRALLVFGRVPMFFYLIHIPLINGLARVAALVRYGPDILQADRIPDDYGYSLAVAYCIWFGLVVVLYFPCRWFMGVKQRNGAGWLSYV